MRTVIESISLVVTRNEKSNCTLKESEGLILRDNFPAGRLEISPLPILSRFSKGLSVLVFNCSIKILQL